MFGLLSSNLFVSDGCCCVVVNGEVVAQGSQFSLKDIEVVVAQVDLDAVGCNLALVHCVHGCWVLRKFSSLKP